MDDPSEFDYPATEQQVVYALAPNCTIDDLEEGSYYEGTVDGIVDYGVFVSLSDTVSGLVHESNITGSYDAGDGLVVELTEIKENGDLSFVPVEVTDYEVEQVEHDYRAVGIGVLDTHEGETVDLEGIVVQIKQTAGPTLFHVADGTGIVPCAAFERAGIRAHPDVSVGDQVHVVGRVERSDHGLQVESDTVARLDPDAELEVRLNESFAANAEPAVIEPLVDWPALAKFMPGLEAVATRLKRAVLEGRPIIIRHHADTDGICAALPLAETLEEYIDSVNWGANAPHHLVKRLPSRAPYYEMEDVVRDLGHALTDRERHGQQLPLFVMIDNGSTAEDVPAYKHLDTYDIPVVVVDHHHPDPAAVEPYVDEHVNPYLLDEDYRVTTGMLCAELSRMIEPAMTEELEHVPAVAGLADRSAADAMADYLELAESKGYDKDELHAIGDGLDYAAYWLRYDAGRGIINDVLDVAGTDGRHETVVNLLSSMAERDIETQLDDALNHVEVEELSSGVRLNRLDVEQFARRFTYPAPGTTTGAVHDHMVREDEDPTITMGVGPDFVVLRSDGVRLVIPEMVSELNDELAGAGVRGGGHLVVGSVRFVTGMRDPVIDALIDKMAEAEIDTSLGATAPRAYGDRA